ncbi:lipid-A-disaccharide synthase [Candidatus Thioglobus autotrophicus]|uniref:lipid-A-disaccharide synthase n=1 Tax=Candidatus Thioglobus autotrophicus TaxID=1705394 RepID=UPI00299EED5C|nr:lipid-A-disaccharide synthase [Candidatus Thioglobus autotrophicus]WPE16600.1 lipid-A-disaccharide synthase [Candidatus Thioglobus autotrophicus]WPE18145.1 lipid-A-disaccharide synthase [Candidatus Thioglobus autotrophicus]
MTKIAISAAETSGDLIGATLVKALKEQDPELQIEGLCGDKMRLSGCDQLWDMSVANVMGFSEVLKKLPSLLKLRKAIVQRFSKNRPDVFIGVDAPDFNFVIEKKLKKQGVKTVHFVSPSVWAWRASRVKKIKRASDLMLCLFPFEVDFYTRHNQRAVFVGHPLAEKLTPRKNHQAGKNILLMPGSRAGEVKRLLPEMLLAAKSMAEQDPALSFHLALANDELLEWTQALIASQDVSLSINEAHERMQSADLVLVASGTAALELALVGVPMVVVYKLSRLSYFIASNLVTSQFISLPNVIANKPLVPELIQTEANGNNIAKHALQILDGDHAELSREFGKIHQSLCLNSSQESAKLILEFIHE